ncbi:hypothetical protein CLOP_g15591 [Closterium sp. NIES-67]|nr:hypothetical protein CLOP_g15591 [Closterium sp. NIES-67]
MPLRLFAQKLILHHLKPNETIAEYVNRAKSYGDELKAMGVPETEKQMISYVIGGLPDEWEAHKGNVSCSRPKTLTDACQCRWSRKTDGRMLSLRKERAQGGRVFLQPQESELQGEEYATWRRNE